jgi:DNA (cytosine-5)-methyltransferase 1
MKNSNDKSQQIKRTTKKSEKFKLNSFFAGIGGFDLGFERAGITPTFHCEVNNFCTHVLRRHWPKTPCVHDILKLTAEEIPDADIWSGGFPCQDVSVARGWLGRAGLKGKNTGLFYPFAELVRQKLPKVVLMENVSGLLNSHDGRDFAVIMKTFQQMGYGVAWRIFNTRYFGAPQSRPRVYICAWRGSATRAVNALYESGMTKLPENARLGFLRQTFSELTDAHVPEVAFCLAATSGRHTGTDWSRTYIAYNDEVRRLTPTECERLQGFPESWTLPHEDFHLSEDAIDTLRYHAIGNAVSVPVVEWVANRIKAELKATAEEEIADQTADAALAYAKQRVPYFKDSKASTVTIETFAEHDDAPKIKWNNGGVMFDGICLMAPVSPAPKKPIHTQVLDLLDSSKPSSRYFLSPNAATGILRRVQSQDRQLFEPLDAALKRLAKKAR